MINTSIRDIHAIDDLARSRGWLQKQSAIGKILTTLSFIGAVMLQGRYALFPVLVFDLAALFFVAFFRLPWTILINRLKCVGLTVLLLGAVNPFLDHSQLEFGDILLSGGIVSLLVLLGKAFAAVSAAFVLTAGTPLTEIGHGLRCLGVPTVLVSTLLLINRYLVLLLLEADKMQTAAYLRSPAKKISWRVYILLIGFLLLRTLDRAEQVQAAMELRGFTGEL